MGQRSQPSTGISVAELQDRREVLLEHVRRDGLSGYVLFGADYIQYFTGFWFLSNERPVIYAESVGGDFYHLFRLPRNRTGVMIGDVSGHGYRAALIMALAMSASAIHAQSAKDPGEMLSMLLATLREELSTTEMYISVFFGIVDHGAGKLRYANTGHPHAFVISSDGSARRLHAEAPPLGLSDDAPPAESVPWLKGKDLLVLFTDGIVDARNPDGSRIGEAVVLELITRKRANPPEEIVTAVFDMLSEHSGGVAHPDDLTLVVLRS